MRKVADLTSAQLVAAVAAAGLANAARRHGDIFNQLRANRLAEAVATMKAGCSLLTLKKLRKALRRELRRAGVAI